MHYNVIGVNYRPENIKYNIKAEKSFYDYYSLKSPEKSGQFIDFDITHENADKITGLIDSSRLAVAGDICKMARSEKKGNVLINAVEGFPPDDAADVIRGAKLIMLCTGIKNSIIALSVKDKESINAIKDLSFDPSLFTLALMPTVYPISYRELLVKTVFPGVAESDILYLTPSICKCIYELLANGIQNPPIRVKMIYKNKYFYADIPEGTTAGDVIKYAESVFGREFYCAFKGEIGVGERLYGNDKISPRVCALSFKTEDEINLRTSSCSGCRLCRGICPMALHPDLMIAEKGENSAKTGISFCIDCGACSAVCPSGIDIPNIISAKRREN